MVAPGGADDAGPRELHRQQAFLFVLGDLLALGCQQHGLHTGQWPRGVARLLIGHVRQGADHDAARLRLPPRVHHGAAVLAHVLFVPMPGLLVDRFAHAADHPQAVQRIGQHVVQSGGYQAADRRGRGVEDVHAVLVDHLPETAGIGEGGHALEQQGGGARQQRTIDQVAVSGDPAHIGRTPVDVALLVLEHVAERVVRVHHVAAAGVHHALRLAGAAAGVQNEQRVLRVHHLRLAVLVHVLQLVVQPHIAALLHRGRPPQALGHDHLLHAGAGLQRLVHHPLHGDLLVAAVQAVAGKHHRGLCVLYAVAQALRAEAAEHHAVDRTDACARQHGHH